MLLIENAEVYAPRPLGRKSMLLSRGGIEAIDVDGAALARAGLELETIDGTGCFAMPGIIDPHAHLIGGSGEKGWPSQTAEIRAPQLLRGGTTTVVGVLGTDTTTRTMPALLARVKGLRDEGFDARAWSGGYDAKPLLDSLVDDITLIEEVIGAGELAIADARGPQFTAAELARVASQCFIAGTFTNKAGLLHLHVGPSPKRLAILRDVLRDFDVQPSTFYPTHVERDEPLMLEALELNARGMPIDLDVQEEDLPRWLRFHREHDGDPSRITASSDAAIQKPHMLFEQIMQCVREDVRPLHELLAIVTANPARILKLPGGELEPGRRADVLLVDRDSLALRQVILNGVKR